MNTSTIASAPIATPHSRLEHFPIALFSTVMGCAGLAIAWLKAHHVSGLPIEVGIGLRWFSTALFLFLFSVYAAKLVHYPNAVKADFNHPVKLNFFPAISIGLLLLAVSWMQDAPGFARSLWLIGAPVHLLFTLAAMNSWIFHTHYEIKHATPAWFIPVVGNVIVPIAGVRFAPVELGWFFFSIGIVFWLVLLTIIFYRLFFHEPLPPRLVSTLFILIAPPAAGFLAYMALNGEVDNFARVLYFSALFLTLLLGINVMRFLRLPFFISAWASSFPLAAMTIATFEMGARNSASLFAKLAIPLLIVVSGVVAVLVVKTIRGAIRGQICVPE